MKKIVKWLVLLCALFSFIMICDTLVQSASIVPLDIPRVICKTLDFDAPSAFLEWEEQQLFAVEGVYSFIGESPVPFTGLSVGWLAGGFSADPGSFEVAIRTCKDKAPWTKWVYFPGDIGPGESPSNIFWSHLYTPIDFGVHTNFEIRIRPPVGVPLTFVRIALFDNSAVPETTPLIDSPKATEAVTPLGAPAQPTIILRPEWLNAEHPWNVSQINITHAIIHHTVTTNNPQTLNDSIQLMRNIRSGHIAQGWSDIGYNFVIDREGRIFQGRHNPWLNTTDVQGAHAELSNPRSVGIALMGQFQPGEPHPTPAAGHPSELALRSLERLLAWRFNQRTLDPLGMANIRVTITIGRNPDGSAIIRGEDRNLHRIIGHRDVNRTVFVSGRTVPEQAETVCPGDNLQVLLPTIRTNVRNLIPPRLHVSPAAVVGSLAPGVGWTTIGTANVTNPSGGTLSWSATSNRAWLSVTPSSGTTITETDSVSVRATAAGLLPGTYTGTLTFTGASPATGTPAIVNVTLTVTTAAPLVSPTAVDGS